MPDLSRSIAFVLFLGTASGLAQEPPAGDAPDGERQRQWGRPEPQAPVVPAQPARMKVAPLPRQADGAARGYAALRAVTTRAGEATVDTADGRRTLTPGDQVGADVVRTVDEGLLVLERPAVRGRPGGPATVVVRFDAEGRATVRVYHEDDPTPVEPPEVR